MHEQGFSQFLNRRTLPTRTIPGFQSQLKGCPPRQAQGLPAAGSAGLGPEAGPRLLAQPVAAGL